MVPTWPSADPENVEIGIQREIEQERRGKNCRQMKKAIFTEEARRKRAEYKVTYEDWKKANPHLAQPAPLASGEIHFLMSTQHLDVSI